MPRRVLPACLAVLAGLVAAPGAADDSPWGLGAQVQLDDDSGVGATAFVDYAASPTTRWSLAATYADAATNLSGLTTTALDLGFGHDFGAVRLDLGIGRWEDADVVAATEGRLGVELQGETVSFALLGSFRRSDFEPFPAAALVRARTGTLVPVTAVADCSIDDVGYGARLRVTGASLSGYLRGMQYDYDDADCDFDSPALDSLRRSPLAQFRQFGAVVAGQLAATSATRIGAENALLESSVGAGVAWFGDRFALALDWSHQTEEFQGLESDSVAGTLTYAATPSTDLDFTVGYWDGEAAEGLPFVGIGVYTRL